ncbi:hypothetical protein A2164_01500 [Candidatus Curtissbacteria bacterium RBG_13_35_7]|uniref:Glycosyltransferase RgtA/B/C/D-like domain-containing protein n=1 Tax=Candidatus Curtissbacteria bacterium RBG_13_35_7 TaxID=1797705 RepID=A0A1F5G1F0_9BACT|nr:MAG: hypothetical protein A2164_01500 [Candidatus Curtissbacteria bacterium RBG_13_35_7]
MIFPIIFFSISAIFGYLLVKRLTPQLYQEELLISGTLLGSVLNLAVNYLLVTLFSFQLLTILLTQILLLMISGVLFITRRKKSSTSNPKLKISLIILIIISVGLFIPLFVSHMLSIKDGNYYTGGASWGDLAFHITLTNSFVYGKNFPPQNPVFSNTKLTYAPLMDFLSAMFICTGSSIQQAMYIPGIFYAVMIVVVSFLIAYEFTKKIFVSLLTPLLFIFNGGIGFIYFISDARSEGKNIFSALFTMTKEYAHLQEYNIRFSNIVADYFLPQRTFLLGFSTGILILIFFFKYFNDKGKGNLLVAGILSGLLPLIHPHSLIAIVIIISVSFLIHFNIQNILNFIKYYLFIFIVIATIPILWIISADSLDRNFLNIQFFWMANKDNPLWFYLKNLGLVLPLILLSFFIVPTKLIKTYIPFATIFIVTNIIVFQPHDYDNMKIMLYWFLASLVLISYFLQNLWQERWLISRILFCVLLFFLIITGVLSVFRESYAIYQIYDREGLELANRIRLITSPHDVILTSDQHNHPITSFSGRPIVMGYRGWLWTWGYNYQEREKDISNIYQGKRDMIKLIKKYNIAFIVVGPSERNMFLINDSFLDQEFNTILTTNHYKIYDARRI